MLHRARPHAAILPALCCAALAGCPPGPSTQEPPAQSGTTGPGQDGTGTGTIPGSESVTAAQTQGDTGGSTDEGVDETGSESSDETGEPPQANRPDLDGDGVIDFVMGARGNDNFAGAVWIDYGADAIADGPAAADVQLNGTSNFGMATTLCDLDGDEVDEVVVGSLLGLHVFWGGAELADDATEDLLITSADQITLVNGLNCADVTGDGLADIVAAGNTGATWTFTVIPGGDALVGRSMLDADAHPDTIRIDSAEGAFTPALGLGDVDGDGVDDIVFGSPTGGLMDPPEGVVLVFFGGPGLDSGTEDDADALMLGSQPSAGFGASLVVGDIDGDDIDDITVSEVGNVVVFVGEPGLSAARGSGGGMHALPTSVPVKPRRTVGIGTPDFRVTGLLRFDLERGFTIASHQDTETNITVVIDATASELTVCSVATDGDQQALPRPLPTPYTKPEDFEPTVQFAFQAPRHGTTDPITFQPAGPGRLQAYQWDERSCNVVSVGDDEIVELPPLDVSGQTTTQWSGMGTDFWSSSPTAESWW